MIGPYILDTPRESMSSSTIHEIMSVLDQTHPELYHANWQKRIDEAQEEPWRLLPELVNDGCPLNLIESNFEPEFIALCFSAYAAIINFNRRIQMEMAEASAEQRREVIFNQVSDLFQKMILAGFPILIAAQLIFEKGETLSPEIGEDFGNWREVKALMFG